MNTVQIQNVMERAEARYIARSNKWQPKLRGEGHGVFRGVFARNELPSIDVSMNFPASYIANTDSASEPGQHWVAFYFTSPTAYEFFDSFAAASPRFYRFTHLPANSTCTQRMHRPVQCAQSNACGQHCLFFLIHRYSESFLHVTNRYSDTNLVANDAMVTNFIFQHYTTSDNFHSNSRLHSIHGGGVGSRDFAVVSPSTWRKTCQLCKPRSSFIFSQFHEDNDDD